MTDIPVATLVPGRVRGELETEPARAGADKILLLRQDQLPALGSLSGSAVPRGIVLIRANPFSHAVIAWLGRGIAMARIDPGPAAALRAGQLVALDAAGGELRGADPLAENQPRQGPDPPVAGRPVKTADGTAVYLEASVGGSDAARRAVDAGAAAVGLVRSEFLLPDAGRRPDRRFYTSAFADLLSASAPLRVTIRLLDLASDKWPCWLERDYPRRTHGDLHGSRLYRFPAVRSVVDAQVAALGALSARSRLELLWPSGGSSRDFAAWRRRVGPSLPATARVGAMVETPIELLALDRWLDRADFVAVGCNDLLAHLYGMARDAPDPSPVPDPYRPELFRLLREAAARAGERLQNVRLCGLLPQIEGLLPVLVGLGYRHFSCEPALIALLASGLSSRSLTACGQLAEGLCGAADGTAVRRLLKVPTRRPWGLAREAQ